MNEIQLFTDGEFNMRTAIVDGEPLFCLVDVCKVLDIQNPSKVAQRLDDDERTKLELGRQGETNFITESGLYAVILRSDKPNAKSFRRWVTSEVLPSIRKTGNYSAKPMTTEEKIKLLAQGNTELSERVDKVEDKIGKNKGYKSVTAYLAANGINFSVINKTEGRFSRYADRVSFPIDEYTSYGAVYEDIWEQLSECTGANKDVFEIERLKGDKGTGHYGKLEPRIAELEDRIKNLEKMVDDLRKELGVD